MKNNEDILKKDYNTIIQENIKLRKIIEDKDNIIENQLVAINDLTEKNKKLNEMNQFILN